jgi:hypothetical protein
MTFMALKLYFIASCRHLEQQIQPRQTYLPFVHVFVGGAIPTKKINKCSLAIKMALRAGNYPGHSRGGGAIREKSREK